MSEFLEAGNNDDVGERDYISRNKKDHNIGYREGNFEGRSDALQKAFDSAYRLYAPLTVIRVLTKATIETAETEQRVLFEDLLERMNKELSDQVVLKQFEVHLTDALTLCIKSLKASSYIVQIPDVVLDKFPALSELLKLLNDEYHFQQ